MADLVPIPLVLVRRLAQAVDMDGVLRRANLPRSRFRIAKPQGTTAEFFALWRAVEQSGAAADLGLRLGVEILSDYDDVAVLAALHSATLGEGLEKLARYKRLVCPEKVWIDIEDGEARLRFEWLLADSAPPTLVTDLLFAFVLSLAQRGTTRPVTPKRVELTRRLDSSSRPRARSGEGRSDAYAGRRRTQRLERVDVRSAPRRRQRGEIAWNEPAHDAAAPRRAWYDVPGGPR
jgi:hypothetical protein